MACVHDGFYSPLLYKFGKMYEISNRTVQNKRTGEKFGPENIIAQYLTEGIVGRKKKSYMHDYDMYMI